MDGWMDGWIDRYCSFWWGPTLHFILSWQRRWFEGVIGLPTAHCALPSKFSHLTACNRYTHRVPQAEAMKLGFNMFQQKRMDAVNWNGVGGLATLDWRLSIETDRIFFFLNQVLRKAMWCLNWRTENLAAYTLVPPCSTSFLSIFPGFGPF